MSKDPNLEEIILNSSSQKEIGIILENWNAVNILDNAYETLNKYIRHINSGTLNADELEAISDKVLKLGEGAYELHLQKFNTIIDHESYLEKLTKFNAIRNLLDLTILKASLKAYSLEKTVDQTNKNEHVVNAKNFEDDAKSLIKKDAPRIDPRYDYFSETYITPNNKMGCFVLDVENGSSYGNSTAYFAWINKEGNIEFKKLITTKNYLHIRGLEETSKFIKLNVSSRDLISSQNGDKFLMLDKKFMNLPGDNYSTLSLEEKLKIEGFSEEHAKFVSNDVQNYLNAEIESGTPVNVESRNKVYYLQDLFGNKKVIKFYEGKKEAFMETTVNYFFPADKDLASLVPGSNLREPLTFNVDDKPIYVVIENDIRENVHLEGYNLKSTKSKKQYFETWMKKMAILHTKGTKLMNFIGNYKPAQDVLREQDKDRIDIVFNPITSKLVTEAYMQSGEEQVFINQDMKPDNIIGFTPVDYGNAGRGNKYTDIAMILNNPKVNLSVEEKKHYLEIYLKFKQEYDNEPINDLEKEFFKYTAQEYVVTTLHSAINELKKDKNSRHPNYLRFEQKKYENEFKKNTLGIETYFMQ